VFEQHVGAYWLAQLLVGGIPPILIDCSVLEVNFQTEHLGWQTDDFLVVGNNNEGQRRKLAGQVKRTFKVSAIDERSLLFGRGYYGWTGYLNGNAPWGNMLRLGYGWNGTQAVFRIGGAALGYIMDNPHIDVWPPSAW
jgi:hypothetical protein